MATINASEDAFRKILKRKRELEEESQKVVTIARALDSLLVLGDERGERAKLR